MAGTARVKACVSPINRFARALGRIGLALLGALGALFVAALIDRVDVDMISVGTLLGLIVYAGLGFYLGIDIPESRLQRADAPIKDKPDLSLLAGATGTLIAALAALISVSLFVLDASPEMMCIMLVGLAWLIGVTMQVVAGSLGRLLRSTEVA
jgi:hypothetical protein